MRGFDSHPRLQNIPFEINCSSHASKQSATIPTAVTKLQAMTYRKLRGWDVERWFERLPMYLLEEPKRQKVLKALSKALALVEDGKVKFSE